MWLGSHDLKNLQQKNVSVLSLSTSTMASPCDTNGDFMPIICCIEIFIYLVNMTGFFLLTA